MGLLPWVLIKNSNYKGLAKKCVQLQIVRCTEMCAWVRGQSSNHSYIVYTGYTYILNANDLDLKLVCTIMYSARTE